MILRLLAEFGRGDAVVKGDAEVVGDEDEEVEYINLLEEAEEEDRDDGGSWSMCELLDSAGEGSESESEERRSLRIGMRRRGWFLDEASASGVEGLRFLVSRAVVASMRSAISSCSDFFCCLADFSCPSGFLSFLVADGPGGSLEDSSSLKAASSI